MTEVPSAEEAVAVWQQLIAQDDARTHLADEALPANKAAVFGALATSRIIADFRHRALRHHAEGVFGLERAFGTTVTVSAGRVVPARLIGEQHCIEDLGFIPSFADWVRCIRPEPWMGRAKPIHRDVDTFATQPAGHDLLP